MPGLPADREPLAPPTVPENLLNLWARNAGSAQLAWSADHGAT